MSMTDNQPAVIDADEFTVRRTIRIAAPIEKVWSAVTEPEHISRWFGRAEIDGTGVGAKGTLTWQGRDAVPLRIEAIDAPRMVSYRWSNDDAGDRLPDGIRRRALDRVHVHPRAGVGRHPAHGRRDRVRDTSDPAANLESHREGWDGELDKLVALLEAGS